MSAPFFPERQALLSNSYFLSARTHQLIGTITSLLIELLVSMV